MVRAHYRDTVLAPIPPSTALAPYPGATVHVFASGTFEPLAAVLYADPSSGASLANPFVSGADGQMEFWLESATTVDLLIEAPGYENEAVRVEVGFDGPPLTEVGSISVSGDLTFNGVPPPGQRIRGDFTSIPVSNRVMFQTTVLDGSTRVGAIPNGIGAASGFQAYGAANPDNTSFLDVGINGIARINTSATGVGSVLPLALATNGTVRQQFHLSGGISLLDAVDPGGGTVRVAGNASVSGVLTVASKPVGVSPDAGNALVWNANGLFVPPSSGGGLDQPTADGLYVNVVGDTMSGALTAPSASFTSALTVATKPVAVSPTAGNSLTWDGTGLYVPTPTTAYSYTYFYQSSTTMADPGFGNFRTNQTSPTPATQMAIDYRNGDSPSVDISALLATLRSGDTIRVQLQTDASVWRRVRLTADPVDMTGWYRLDITDIGGAGTVPATGSCLITFFLSGGSGSGLDQPTADGLYVNVTGDVMTGALEIRNGVNPQILRVYNTYTDASNNELGEFGWVSNQLGIRAVANGTGVLRNLVLDGDNIYFRAAAARNVYYQIGGATVGFYSNTGLYWGTDNSFDIGGNTYQRNRNIFAAGAVATGVKAGVPVDGDVFQPTDGMLRVDSTANVLYVRSGGAWRAAGGGLTQTAADARYLQLTGGTLAGPGNLSLATATATGDVNLAGRIAFTAAWSGTAVAGTIYGAAIDGLAIRGFAGSTNDIYVMNKNGQVALNVPTGTQNVVIGGYLTFNLATTPPAGGIGKSTANGAVLRGVTGSTYDLQLQSAAGTAVLSVPTGTTNVVAAGILGVAGIPKAWDVASVIDFVAGSTGIRNSGRLIQVMANHYFDNAYRNTTANPTTMYSQQDGVHTWYCNASPGAAGTSFGPTSRMTLDVSGNLTLVTGTLTVGGVDIGATLATKVTNPMSASGDIIYGGASGVPTRLAAGSNTQVLTLAGGVPTWATPASGGMTNPMTAAGDIIVGGASGAATRLAAGTNGFVLKLAAGTPSWAADVGFANPMTTQDDLIIGGASGAPTRLAEGTNGQVLTVTAGVVGWAASVGFANPMTAVGDLIRGGTSGAPTRLAVGAADAVLTSQSGIPAWSTTLVTTGITNTGRVTFSGNSTALAGSIYKTAADGLVIQGITGSTNDLVLENNAGAIAMRLRAGTQTVIFNDTIGVTGCIGVNTPTPRTMNGTAVGDEQVIQAVRRGAGSAWITVDNPGTCGYWLNDSSQVADSRIWGMESSSAVLKFNTYTDAGVATTRWSLDRSGNTTVTGNITPSPTASRSLGASTNVWDRVWSRTVSISDAPATYRTLEFQTSGSVRWALVCENTAEAAGNAGSNFVFNAFDNTGAYLSSPFSITRSNGVLNANNGLSVTGTITGSSTISATTAFLQGATPATTGGLRLSNNSPIVARDAANGSDQTIANFDASNLFLYAGSRLVINPSTSLATMTGGLSVAGQISQSGALGVQVFSLELKNTTASSLTGMRYFDTPGTDRLQLAIFNSGYGFNNDFGVAGASTSQIHSRGWPLYVGTSGAASLFLATNGTARVTIDSAGATSFGGAIQKSGVAIAGLLLSMATGATVPAAPTTQYGCPPATNLNATENIRQAVMPRAGTGRNLYVTTTGAQPSSGSLVVTLRKNGVNTAVTLTIAASAAAGTFSDTTNSVAFVAGDLLSIGFTNNATAVSATIGGFSLTYDI